MVKEQFIELSKKYNKVPIYFKTKNDLFTPTYIMKVLMEKYKSIFLLESAEVNEKVGRYSFIGINAINVIEFKNNRTYFNNELVDDDIFSFIDKQLQKINYPELPELPIFKGGYVGYFAYEIINSIESTVNFNYDLPFYPLVYLSEFEFVIAIDHFKQTITIIKNISIQNRNDLLAEYELVNNEIRELYDFIKKGTIKQAEFNIKSKEKELKSVDEMKKIIEKAKNYIFEGDIFQVVLSNKYMIEYEGDTFELYRNLRHINPSPYMFYLSIDEKLQIIGASPESLVRCVNNQITINPIAGTRKRGKNAEDEERLINNLLNDEKEKAEHLMLVDLARNDIGKVSEIGSVKVTEYMKLNKFSHVMHLVSTVESKLKNNFSVVDLLKSCFPAGTVSGAPKIRAMQIISELENFYRGIYSGAIGYFDYSKNMDFCIAIRTFVAYDNILELQAGAGIVADSVPELEIKEIRNKVAVLFEAIKSEV